MDAILPPETLAVVGIRPAFASAFGSGSASFPHQMPCTLLFQPGRKPPVGSTVGSRSERISGLRRSPALAAAGTLMANSVPVCYLTLSASFSTCLPELNTLHTMELYGHGTDIFYFILFYIFEVFLFSVFFSICRYLLLIVLTGKEFQCLNFLVSVKKWSVHSWWFYD